MPSCRAARPRAVTPAPFVFKFTFLGPAFEASQLTTLCLGNRQGWIHQVCAAIRPVESDPTSSPASFRRLLNHARFLWKS